MRPNHATAQRLRDIARQFERHGGIRIRRPMFERRERFTCNAVGNRCGRDIEDAYADIFGFAFYKSGGNEDILWNMCDVNMRDMRVLLLCFAAALAETGDL